MLNIYIEFENVYKIWFSSKTQESTQRTKKLKVDTVVGNWNFYQRTVSVETEFLCKFK